MKIILFILLLTTAALAKVHFPPAFDTHKGWAQYVDFLQARYDITYDVSKKMTLVTATILFHQSQEGLPIFDSVEEPLKAHLDGRVVSTFHIYSPEDATSMRVVDSITTPGMHELKIQLPIKTNVDFSKKGVTSGFWISDLADRSFLELYLPASFEYDQVKMTFFISVLDTKTDHDIFTNGELQKLAANKFQINFPDYFTSSSIFYHLVPENSKREMNSELTSMDGRRIPLTIYLDPQSGGSELLKKLTTETQDIFHELEADFGPWPHPSLLMYISGESGMEYAGAATVSPGMLGHELFHSYFGRGVMPANGNAGWLDEALAVWKDKFFPLRRVLQGNSPLSNHSAYKRNTDGNAYSFGADFIGYLEGRLQTRGGLKPFLRFMVEEHKFQPLTVEEFILAMNTYYHDSFDADFYRYTY